MGFATHRLCYSALHFRARDHFSTGAIGLAERPVARSTFTQFLRYWLPVLLYLTLIVTLSAQPSLKPPERFELTDKFYHTLEYFGLGLLLARAFRAGGWVAGPLINTALALVLGIAIGAADEIFQSTVPGRSSDIFDVLADGSGVLLAQFLYLLVVRE